MEEQTVFLQGGNCRRKHEGKEQGRTQIKKKKKNEAWGGRREGGSRGR